MHFRPITSPLLCALLLAAPAWATAAGIDCTRARSPSEIAICGDKELVSLDAQLAKVYAQARRAPRVPLAQRQWLKKTASCAADTDCLKAAYTDRMSELHQALWALQAYRPDAVDERALAQLRHAVQDAFKTDSEMGLSLALASVAVESGLTEFQNVPDPAQPGEPPSAPTIQPPGVSPDEWQAFTRSKIEARGENGMGSSTLLDVDGDGQRDVIVDTYSGGTGLFNYVNVLQRHGDRFVNPLPRLPGVEANAFDNALYTLGGRGGNQGAYWVKLQGRVYAAYVDETYGQAQVNLLQPLQINGISTPTLTVHYAYTLSVPRRQKVDEGKREIVLSTDQQRALTKGLSTVSRSQSSEGGDNGKSLCPMPANIRDDEKFGYASFGTGHYSYEIVGDFPVWYGKECRIGRLSNWFGAYSKKHGLHTMLSVRKAGSAEDADTQEDFSVTGRRRVTRIESSMSRPTSN